MSYWWHGHTNSPQRCSDFISRGFCPFTKALCQHGGNLNRTMEAEHHRLMITSLDREMSKGYSRCCFMISTDSIKWKLREIILAQDGNYTLTGPRAEASNLLWISSHWDWTQSQSLPLQGTPGSPGNISGLNLRQNLFNISVHLGKEKKKKKKSWVPGLVPVRSSCVASGKQVTYLGPVWSVKWWRQ